MARWIASFVYSACMAFALAAVSAAQAQTLR